MQLPKYQTIYYKAIENEQGVFAYESKKDKPNDTIPLPKCLRLETPLKPCAAKLFLCAPFYQQHTNEHTGGKKLTGLFETIKPKIWSGDVWHNDKKNTVLLRFNDADPIFSNWLKVYYFINFYVTPNRISKLVYTTFTQRRKQGYNF